MSNKTRCKECQHRKGPRRLHVGIRWTHPNSTAGATPPQKRGKKERRYVEAPTHLAARQHKKTCGCECHA